LTGMRSDELDALYMNCTSVQHYDECWSRVMEQWLANSRECEYSTTWEGLYQLLKDVQYFQVATDLKEAVTKASLHARH
jgi:hypothetical protein